MLGVRDIFKIGLGPSSSHTVGPMVAARAFAERCRAARDPMPRRVEVRLLGSLAWTGRGHGTCDAVALGLSGLDPATCDPEGTRRVLDEIDRTGELTLAGRHRLPFARERDIVLDRRTKPTHHPNTLALRAMDEAGAELRLERWCSIGGGFVVLESELGTSGSRRHRDDGPGQSFRSAEDLLHLAGTSSGGIAQVMRAEERRIDPACDVDGVLDGIADAMFACIERGLSTEGMLPGGLRVKRRAAEIWSRLDADLRRNAPAPTRAYDAASAFAIAVNEENAAGGRVVTAPTNGAAGVVPAVLRYVCDFHDGGREAQRVFLLTAAAIAILIKTNASISGAEVGCQGEVGTAAAMAAAGLAAAMGGNPAQIENAAEIALEHHLGMTCDPVGGLVQVPCIERNAFGAVKAISAASLALMGDGRHVVSLDAAIRTMRQTGADMKAKYKETSRGGLAANVAC